MPKGDRTDAPERFRAALRAADRGVAASSRRPAASPCPHIFKLQGRRAVAAVAAPVAKPSGARPSDIAHIGVPDSGSRRALCCAPVRGVPAPPGVGECVVCTEL
jgi:hypothetical protein